MRVLSLFSGGGLGDYGLELAGMEIVGQVEIDDYCQKILKLRWPDVQKWKDIKEFDGKAFVKEFGQPDLISGGFPCQDISVAGRGVGITGARSGLWKEMFRIICEIRPRYVLVENVTALLGRGLGVVLGDLAESGYDTEWDCIPASAVSAPHQRDRVWIVAHALRCGRSSESREQQEKRPTLIDSGGSGELADAESEQTFRQGQRRFFTKPSQCSWWSVEPNVGRVAHGVAKRVDRLKLLGNGQVVQVVQWIGERIMEFEKSNTLSA